MITVIRNYFNRHAYIILWVIVGAFIIGLLPMAMQNISDEKKWAIRVNGQGVSHQEFVMESEKQRERILALREQYGEYADWILQLMGQSNPNVSAAQALIQKELVNQFGDSVGVQISSDAIAEKMANPQFIQQELSDVIPPYLVDPIRGIDLQRLQQHLKRFGMNTEMLEAQIERSLLDKLMLELIASMAYVPEFDVKQRYQAEHAKKSFSITTIPLSGIIEELKKTPVSAKALSEFYEEQNKASRRYWVPEKRSGKEWVFSPEAIKVSVSDAQIKEHYEKNKLKSYVDSPAKVQVRRILISVPDEGALATARAKAGRLRDEILQDTSKFAEIAKRESDDKVSAEKGGLLEPFARGSHEQVFDKAAFLLPEDGALSDVIETQDGIEILQRVKKTPQKFKALSSVKDEIKQQLVEKSFANAFANQMQKIIGDNERFSAFARRSSVAPKEVKRVASDANQQLFTLQVGNRTFSIDDGKATVVQLDEIHDAYLPSLEAIKAKVTDDYYADSAQKKLSELSKEAQQNMKNADNAAKSSTKGTLSQTGLIDPKEEKAVERLKEKGLPAEQMLQMEKAGSVIAHQDDTGASIIRLDEIAPINAEKYEKDASEVARSLREQRMRQYLEGFVASLHRNAKIETNESVITLQ